MKKIYLLCITLLFVAAAFAQQNVGSISGRISNGGDQKIIDAATITLFKSVDSSLVKVALADKEGNFSFENLPFNTYFIKATTVGYEAVYSEMLYVNSAEPVLAGLLTLEKHSTTLAEVSVVAKKPFIERKIDKTIVNVDASISNTGTTALELLEKSPGISVDKDGNVSLNGKQGVMILMDGRPSYLSGQELSNLLKNMSSSGIEQIEIMTNPSAKYEAAGNSGVINIVTKKNKMRGTNGSLSLSAIQSDLTRTSNSLNINHRNGKVNLFGNYSYSYWQNKREAYFYRRFKNPESGDLEAIFDQGSNNYNQSQNHNLKAGLDFYATKKTIFGAVFSGYYNPGENSTNATTKILNNKNALDSLTTSDNFSDRTNSNFATNLNMRHTFDSTGKSFTIDLDYINYTGASKMSLVGNYFNPDGSIKRPGTKLHGNLPSNLNIYSAKVDYYYPISKDSKIEAGLKSSYVTTDNNADYKTTENGKDVIDIGKTNHFLYDENINAAYVNWSGQLKRWGVQAGLRTEHTFSKGHQLGNASRPDSSFTKNYINLFPTVYVSYNLNEKNVLSANYGRRIGRPDYEDLNPFYYFIDEYTYQVGNTLLQPQFTNNYELSHTYAGFLTTSINYSHTENAFAQVIKQLTDEKKTYQTNENLATKKVLSASVNAGFPVTKFWRTNMYFNVGNTEYKGPLDGGMLVISNTMFMTNISNQFKLSKSISAELSGFYRSQGIEGQILIDELWKLDGGIQSAILKNKGTLKFSVRDIFNSMGSNHATVNYREIDLDVRNIRESRTFTVSFSYRFGKPLKNTQQRKSGGASDEQNRIKSSGN